MRWTLTLPVLSGGAFAWNAQRTTPAWVNPTSPCFIEMDFNGWDCNSAKEVLDKYTKILLMKVDPLIAANIIQWVPLAGGSFICVVQDGYALQITPLDTATNYGQSAINKFFGNTDPTVPSNPIPNQITSISPYVLLGENIRC